jgi:translation elongation factor EF-Tu-like GTPase
MKAKPNGSGETDRAGLFDRLRDREAVHRGQAKAKGGVLVSHAQVTEAEVAT